jgi:hypothetical protein
LFILYLFGGLNTDNHIFKQKTRIWQTTMWPTSYVLEEM